MIKLIDICKTYNKNKENEFRALKNINLTIADGEIVAITGPSGAGKSTLMHIIGCIDDFDSGKYELNDADISKLNQRKRAKIRNSKVGIVMQDFALVEEYTAEENVSIPLYFGKHMDNKKNRVKEALREIGIEELAKKKINQLSGGQKQRVAIARALINNPDILIADEPTGALDIENSEKIMDIFLKIKSQGKTVIIVTHDTNIANHCERIIRIEDGEISD